jgi:hypothetical protein
MFMVIHLQHVITTSCYCIRVTVPSAKTLLPNLPANPIACAGLPWSPHLSITVAAIVATLLAALNYKVLQNLHKSGAHLLHLLLRLLHALGQTLHLTPVQQGAKQVPARGLQLLRWVSHLPR